MQTYLAISDDLEDWLFNADKVHLSEFFESLNECGDYQQDGEHIGCVFDHTSDGWGWSAFSRYGGMADVRYRMPSRDDAIRHLATMACAAPADKEST